MIPGNKKKQNRKLFRLSYRSALWSGIVTALAWALILWFFSSVSPDEAALLSLTAGLLSFIIVYLVTWRVHYQRMETINRITRNIARKLFEDYEHISTGERDELDYLIMQSVRASKMVEKEIQRLNKIENYRKEFIGDISHELKTPIFAIQGFIETLLNGALEDEEVNRVFLNKAMRNVNRLIFLTKDLMEISKLETGELKSTIQEVYLRDVVLDVVESLQYKAQKENVEIRINDFDKNVQVKADRNQIKQVLINLIENGIKYNRQQGYVEIGIRPFPKNRRRVLLYVQDTGVGIDQNDISRVTERFFRVDKSRSREKGGTGLGLSIVKHIMEAHGEELFIESSPNKGSTFSMTLSRVNHEPERAL